MAAGAVLGEDFVSGAAPNRAVAVFYPHASRQFAALGVDLAKTAQASDNVAFFVEPTEEQRPEIERILASAAHGVTRTHASARSRERDRDAP